MFEYFKDAFIDSIKLLPFLFLTYLVMEFLEHKSGRKLLHRIQKAEHAGPLLGGLFGIFPQCGFCAAASSLYAGRVITVGTLFAIFLSTSDEMIPIFLSEEVALSRLFKILLLKMGIAIITGYLIELIYEKLLKKHLEHADIHHVCEHEHCHCEDGLLVSAAKHTLKIFTFIFIISFLLNMIIGSIGENRLAQLFSNAPLIGHALSALVGLIPNCASSVVITQLYLEHVLSTGALFSGLLANAGVGLLILFRLNDRPKENISILSILFFVSIVWGIVLDAIGLVL